MEPRDLESILTDDDENQAEDPFLSKWRKELVKKADEGREPYRFLWVLDPVYNVLSSISAGELDPNTVATVDRILARIEEI